MALAEIRLLTSAATGAREGFENDSTERRNRPAKSVALGLGFRAGSCPVNQPPDNPTPVPASMAPGTDMQAQRDALRRGLLRANFAAVSILAMVVALAAGFVWKARESAAGAARASDEAARANTEAGRAQHATELAKQELWNARLSEARARRIAGGPGARIATRRMIEELSRRPGLTEDQRLALRQEAIEQLALLDIEVPEVSVKRDAERSIVWSADLKRYLRFPDNGAVTVNTHPPGEVVVEVSPVPGTVPHSAVLSRDGHLLAIRYRGGAVHVRRVSDGGLVVASSLARVPNHNSPLYFAPDSRRLGMYTAEGFAILAAERGAIARVLNRGRVVDGAAFTVDAKTLAVLPQAELDVVEIWNADSGAVRQRFKLPFRAGAIEWLPDGRRLALSGERGLVTIWEMYSPTGDTNGFPRESGRFTGHLGTIVYLMPTPDGSKIFTHSWDTTSRFWDVMSGAELFRETRVSLEGISMDGREVLGILPGGKAEVVCPLHPPDGFRVIASVGGPKATHGVWTSPDGRLVAVGYPAGRGEATGEVRLWDFTRGVELTRVPGIWAQFSPDSRWLYAFEFRGIRRYDIRAETLAAMPADWTNVPSLYTPVKGELVNTGEVYPDGRTIAVAAMDRVLWLDAETGRRMHRIDAAAHYLSMSADGSQVATAFQNQPTTLRMMTTGQALARSTSFGRATFSRDTNWVAVVEADALRLHKYPGLERAFQSRLDLGASTPPSLAFSPDCKMLAVTYNRVGLRLYEIPSGRVLAGFGWPGAALLSGAKAIEFTHDGRWLMAARDTGDVVGWDLDVIRRELKGLGLDWSAPAAPAVTNAAPAGLAATLGNGVGISGGKARGSSIETVALAGALLTLFAGLFVFALQRRLLASYGRLETLAVNQHQRLASAQSELLHGQKMRALGTLAAGIAHDFNNLLSVIRLSNQLAAEQTKPSGAAKENVEAIESAVTQGENIVQSMLGYSRAAVELDTTYAMDAAIGETVAMLGRKFLAGIVLKLDIARDLPPVRGSRGRMEQVLLNLIVNASEAMAGQGTLRITAARATAASGCLLTPRGSPAGFIEVLVADSGPGIPAEVLPRIFEPFFTTKSVGARPGTGLGLATVYTMAEQDGLGLGVETSAASGTTFRLLVPVDDSRPASA